MSTVDRRWVLGAAGASLGSFALSLGAAGASSRRKRPLAITDITVRKELHADFPGTLAALRSIGYSHFGTRLYSWSKDEPPEPSPREKARMLADTGLRAGVARLGADVPLARQIDDAATIGARVLALSAGRIFVDGIRPRENLPSLGEFEDYLGELEDMGTQIRSAGLVFAYHNHAFEAQPIEGVRALDRMIAGTDPAKVSFELDLAWAHIGGYDLIDLINRVGKRLVSMHFKDVNSKAGGMEKLVAPGDGDLDYARLIPLIRARTRALPAVEVDAPIDGIATAARAWRFINAVR